jgi:hypothetical protein
MKLKLFPLLFVSTFSFAQKSPNEIVSKLGKHPMYIIDSVRLTTKEFLKFDANTIASVEILTDTDATKRFGDDAKDGVIIGQTKMLARSRYLRYFRAKSSAFDSLYKAAGSDSTFQYIVNDKLKTNQFEGDLAAIDDNLFISLEILTADDLKQKYQITDKSVGVLIKCRKPKNLFNGDSKF